VPSFHGQMPGSGLQLPGGFEILLKQNTPVAPRHQSL
jgi:hypothetical protein